MEWFNPVQGTFQVCAWKGGGGGGVGLKGILTKKLL